MPAENKIVQFVSGKIYWAKILNEPVFNKFRNLREWSFEFEPDAGAELAKIINNGLKDRIKGKGYDVGRKNQYADREPFIKLSKPEFNKKGDPNPHIRVYNSDSEEWDSSSLIGNESSVDVKLDIRDYGSGMMKGVYPVAIRVTKHVPYVSSEFGAMDKDIDPNSTSNAGQEFEDDDLNDEDIIV